MPEQIRQGEHVYKVGRVLGGVTYQILVTAGDRGPTPPSSTQHPLKLWWIILILLLLLIVLFLLFRKKKTA